jgi:NADH:ubiquinone oxidoreductase subunit F (NADH-binding)
VQNVETLAHLALIGRYGASWFRSAGTPAEPGTMLVTVLGAVRQPGVLEIAIGTQLGHLLDLADGASAPLQALLLGGYFGAWAAAAETSGRPFSSAGLADLGARPGAGLTRPCPRTPAGWARPPG